MPEKKASPIHGDIKALNSSEHDVAAQERLEKLGYREELTRSRGLFHTLFMTLAIMSVPFGLSAPIETSLIGGGPAVMIWGWILVCIVTQPLALSLAEITSKYPTSAGAYYWCYRFAPPNRRLLYSWINGWLTMVGVWTICLSVTFGTAQLFVAGAGIYHPEWVAAPWQTYLVFLAVTAVASGVGILGNRILPTIDVLSACWTVLGMITMVVCLSVKAASGRRPASFALGHFDPSASGWTPGWSFVIGLLPVRYFTRENYPLLYTTISAYTFSAIGMIASMAEEVHDPAVQVPQAIAWSIPIGSIVGLVFLLPILFTLPDIATLLAVPSGQPLGLMFQLIMGSQGGGFAMWFIIIVIALFCAISCCTAASRATWSFARDRAIPFYKIFSKVNQDFNDLPLNAFLLSTTIQVLVALIFLGSSTAFNAFVGVGVICLSASYAMPVAISAANARKDIHGAPFSLGRWGFFLNIWAVLWVLFEIVLFSMPAVIPVSKVTMNYASVLFVGFAVISAVWYLINGRFHYKGPPIPQDFSSSENASSADDVVQVDK